MNIFKIFLNVPISLTLLTARVLHSKCSVLGPVRIIETCDLTLDREGVHICHILKELASKHVTLFTFSQK